MKKKYGKNQYAYYGKTFNASNSRIENLGRFNTLAHAFRFVSAGMRLNAEIQNKKEGDLSVDLRAYYFQYYY